MVIALPVDKKEHLPDLVVVDEKKDEEKDAE
jgi:hypothetical protein